MLYESEIDTIFSYVNQFDSNEDIENTIAHLTLLLNCFYNQEETELAIKEVDFIMLKEIIPNCSDKINKVGFFDHYAVIHINYLTEEDKRMLDYCANILYDFFAI